MLRVHLKISTCKMFFIFTLLMFKKTNAKGAFENFHLQNVLFLHFYCLEKQINKDKINIAINFFYH